MKAHEILGSKVIEVAHGTDVGTVVGLLIDTDERRVVAVGVHAGGALTPTRYIPFENIVSVENDVVTIPAKESLLDRNSFRTADIMESMKGRKIITEDGRELGELLDYSIDPKSGEIQSVIFAPERRVLAGLIKKSGEHYEAPGVLVRALGQNIIVDNSTPDVVGLSRAA